MSPCRRRLRRNTRDPEQEVPLRDLVHRPANGKRRRNDGARGGAGNQIKVVAQAERVVVAVPPAQLFLDALENAQRQDAAQSATVERENPLRSANVEMLLERTFRIRQRPSSSRSVRVARCARRRSSSGVTGGWCPSQRSAAACFGVPWANPLEFPSRITAIHGQLGRLPGSAIVHKFESGLKWRHKIAE